MQGHLGRLSQRRPQTQRKLRCDASMLEKWMLVSQSGNGNCLGQRIVICAARSEQRRRVRKERRCRTFISDLLLAGCEKHWRLTNKSPAELLLSHIVEVFVSSSSQPPFTVVPLAFAATVLIHVCLFRNSSPSLKSFAYISAECIDLVRPRRLRYTAHNGSRLARGRRPYAGSPLRCCIVAYLREGL